MILDSMLSNSPVFLFAVSAALLAGLGVVRAIQAAVRSAHRHRRHD